MKVYQKRSNIYNIHSSYMNTNMTSTSNVYVCTYYYYIQYIIQLYYLRIYGCVMCICSLSGIDLSVLIFFISKGKLIHRYTEYAHKLYYTYIYFEYRIINTYILYSIYRYRPTWIEPVDFGTS